MAKSIFISFLFLFGIKSLSAQILVSQIGNMRYYNSLDSGKSAWINSLSHRCLCMLNQNDSTHNILFKLDIDTISSITDTSYYHMEYNILTGNFVPNFDSATLNTVSENEQPGIFIKARDTVINEDILFRLLDYGISHFSELKLNLQTGKVYDKSFAGFLIEQKPSLKFRRALTYCKQFAR